MYSASLSIDHGRRQTHSAASFATLRVLSLLLLLSPSSLLYAQVSFAPSTDSSILISFRQHFSAADVLPGRNFPERSLTDATAIDVPQWQPYDGRTMLLQTLLGAAGGAAVFAVGYGIGGWHQEGLDELAHLVVGYFLGTVVGIPLGVYYGGELMGGDGKLWPTIVCGLLGSGLGGVALGITREQEITIPLFVIATIAPPIIGYHESAAYIGRSRPAALPSESRVHGGGENAPSMSISIRACADPTVPRPDVSFTLLRVPL
ncbi:MAG: hypothetical protein IH600_00635 [Bacteroidetes bacterium]|nr:hypothetical protein [Bacteroidota bacterium]